MKNLHHSIFFLLILSFVIVSPAFAQTYNFRLLFHGTKEVSDGFGIAAWIACPNMTNNSQKWLVVAGPSYNYQNKQEKTRWGIEVMGGTFVEKGISTPLLDVRVCYDDEDLSRFINVQWIDPGKSNLFYVFADINYALPLKIGKIGIETENNFSGSKNDLSAGPHLIIPFNGLTLVTAYQFHDRNDQIWCRAIVNF